MVETWFEPILRLKSELPVLPVDSSTTSIEDQARAVLACVVDPIIEKQLGVENAAVVDPTTCPNCGFPVQSTRTPYCSEPCREMAGFVRQFRTGLKLGWILEAEKQVALGQVLWHVLGGGRPLRQQIAPLRARQTALKREEERCQVCGSAATTVDHIGSGCNRPINLRAVCEECCQDHPFGDPRILVQPEVKQTVLEIARRIGSPEPIRCCDDAESWDWRSYLRQRC